MSGEVVTQDIGNGYQLNTYNVETYYKTQTIISPVALPAIQEKPPAQLFGSAALGQYQPYCLSQFVQPRDFVAEKGELIELAHVEKDKLKIHDDAIEVFKRYPGHEISFVGNYGRLNSGKSFWYDKILNLSQFDGHSYSQNKSRQGIYFWSIPFSKGKLKFFLLDYVGFQGNQNLTREDELLLDLELLLAQKFVIVPQPEDEELTVLPVAYNHLLQSQQRFTDKGVVANKFSPYWPNQIYTLYRSSRPVRRQIDNIGTLFEVYNFSIIHDALGSSAAGGKRDLAKSTILEQQSSAPLNEKYVRMTSVVFQDIYEKMKGKKYNDVTFNGENLPRIMEQATQTINDGKGVKMDEIFKGVKKDISEDTMIRSKMLFEKEVEPLRRDPRAKPVEVLLDGFDRGNQAAFGYFDQSDLTREEKRRLEPLLREDIDKREEEILEQNKRKTYIHYTQALVPPANTDAEHAYSSLKQTYIKDQNMNHLNHEDTQPVARQLKSIVVAGQPESQELVIMRTRLYERQKELEDLEKEKEKNPEAVVLAPQKQRMAETRDILSTRVIHLRQAVDDEKQLNYMDPESKKSYLQKLREEHQKNQVYKTKLAEQSVQNPKIKSLRDQLSKVINKNRQHQEGVSSLQKSFMSQRSNKSVIRDIKEQHVRKTSIK